MPLDPNKLRALREARGLTTVEAAARSGMAQPNYVRLEQGRKLNPRIETVERLARAMGVSVTRLLSE